MAINKPGSWNEILETLSTLTEVPDLLEWALDTAQDFFSPQQSSIYLMNEEDGTFHLELCFGCSPLDLTDQFSMAANPESPEGSLERAEIIAGQTGEIVEKGFMSSGKAWYRNALPLKIERESHSKTLGVLVLDFPEKPDLNSNDFQDFTDPIAYSLFEILTLDKLKANQYASLRILGSKEKKGPRMDVALAEALARELGIEDREVEEIKNCRIH